MYGIDGDMTEEVCTFLKSVYLVSVSDVVRFEHLGQ